MPDLDERLEHEMRRLAEAVPTEGSFERVRARVTRHRRRRQLGIALAVTAALSGAALAGMQLANLGDTGTHQLRATKPHGAPAVSTPSSLPGPPPGGSTVVPPPVFRFHQDTYTCSPELTAAITRTWQVSAPRTPQIGATSVSIGLRNKMAGSMGDRGPLDPQIMLPAPDVELWAQVVTPDGVTYTSKTLRLLPDPPDNFMAISYPTAFPQAPALTPGTYTVVWTTRQGSLACDGFTIG
jgi:hypothetical protein